MSNSSSVLADFLASKVADGVAPGLIAVAFSRATGGVTAQASAGQRGPSTPSEGTMDLDTTVWMASMAKSVNSMAALILVEKHAFDLDSNAALSAIVPELKLGNGEETDFIFDGKDSEGKWKKRRATVGITLRHLLLHVSGLGYNFTAEATRDMYEPTGSLPIIHSGDTRAFNIPRLFESGTAYCYGCSTDWVGRFVERISGLTLREAYQSLVFDPLGITSDTLDVFRSPGMDINKATMCAKTTEGSFSPFAFDTAQFEGVPPTGFATVASSPLWGTVPAYAAFVESFLYASAPPPRTAGPNAKPLISRALWEDASSDGLAKLGLTLHSPVLRSTLPLRSNDIDAYYPAKTDEGAALGEGWTMLQTFFNRRESATGMNVGTIGWAGLMNSYYFADAQAGVGGVVLAQMLPFADPEMMAVRDQFDRLVYSFGSTA